MFYFVLLNYFFFIFHTVFTLFNLFGWISKYTRKIHLITVILTVFSWYILGIWYGLGYCFCTDWHWKIRERLGYVDESNSYIHFLIKKLTGINFNEELVVKITIILFFICFLLSIVLNIFYFLKKSLKNKKNA